MNQSMMRRGAVVADRRGWLVKLLVGGIAVAGLAALVHVYNVEQARPRIRLVEQETRRLATAVERHRARTGKLPDRLADLTVAPPGVTPEIPAVPHTPSGWGEQEYHYERRADGTFTIWASGDDRTIRAP